MRRHQEIGALKQQLRDAGATAAAMSGSGSAVFGLFRGRAAAERAGKALARRGAKVFVTRTLTRAEHERRGKPVAVRRSSRRPSAVGFARK
jgi:4-diphosphocytidyl-2C-methyl-D-erythritol kinase